MLNVATVESNMLNIATVESNMLNVVEDLLAKWDHHLARRPFNTLLNGKISSVFFKFWLVFNERLDQIHYHSF